MEYLPTDSTRFGIELIWNADPTAVFFYPSVRQCSGREEGYTQDRSPGFRAHVFELWAEIRAPELNLEPSCFEATVFDLLSWLISIWVKGQNKRVKGSGSFWAMIKSSPVKVVRWKRKVWERGAQEEPNSETMTQQTEPWQQNRQHGWRRNSENHEIGEPAPSVQYVRDRGQISGGL